MAENTLKTIATHSGTFHADECLALYMILLLPEWKTVRIVRTRDPVEIDAADMVVDVGAQCDPSRNRFDHHQREFVETFSEKHTITRLSSAGLIYKYFGKTVISTLLEWPMDHQHLELVYQKVYDDFIEGIDAIDNGVSRYPTSVTPLYNESSGISSRVSRLNPEWNETNVDIMAQFLKAIAMTGEELTYHVNQIAKSWLPARDLVSAAYKARFDIHPSGKIILFDTYCRWKDHLYNEEEALKLEDKEKVLYVVYQDPNSEWRVQAAPVSRGSFASLKALPEPWRGIRDNDLSTLTGISDCVFIHATGFIGGTKTRQGSIDLAIKAVEY